MFACEREKERDLSTMRSSVRFLRQSASPLSPSSTSFPQVGQGNSMVTGGVSLRLRPGCVPHTAQKEREIQLEKAVSNIKVSLSPNKSKPGKANQCRKRTESRGPLCADTFRISPSRRLLHLQSAAQMQYI